MFSVVKICSSSAKIAVLISGKLCLKLDNMIAMESLEVVRNEESRGRERGIGKRCSEWER